MALYRKENEQYICNCHETNFETKKDAVKHCQEYRWEQGKVTPWELHRYNRCAKDSRVCRYCHPEMELGKQDVYVGSKLNSPDLSIDKRIKLLLSVEQRYRNKFLPEHIPQLQKKAKDKGKYSMYNMIRSRIVKRQQKIPENDGYQTPYISHYLDPAFHATATCCRGCIERWHHIDRKDHELTEEEVNRLTDVVYRYLIDYIIDGPLEKWMTEIPDRDIRSEPFYEPGVSVKGIKLQKEIKGDRTNWKEYVKGTIMKEVNEGKYEDLHEYVISKWAK